MPIQSTTAREVSLARMRAAFVDRHGLRDYQLSAHNLMRMIRSAGAGEAAIRKIRERFTLTGANWIQWPDETFDHCELLGKDRMPFVLISHPYRVTDEGRADLELFRSAGLNVVEGGKSSSWYGFGSFHVRIEHPAFAGVEPRPAALKVAAVRPSPTSDRLPGETSLQARLRRAGPELLQLARERAAELAAAIHLMPCTGAGGTTCLRCELQGDLDRIVEVIREVEGLGSLDSTEPPLFPPQP